MSAALTSSDAKQWKDAIDAEYSQLVKRGVFEKVDNLPPGKRAIGSKVVLKEKLDEYGCHTKFKARIVAKGFSQIPGIDSTDTFLSVAKFTSLHIFLTLAAILDYEIHQIDIIGAYLEGHLDEEIYMRPPKGVGDGGFWKLLKAIYGLKQAGRKWKERLHDVLLSLGFKQSHADDCLYILRSNGKIILIVLVYVDDMAVASKNLKRITSFKKNLKSHFDTTNLRKIHYILGLHITWDCANRIIYLNQTAYIDSILKRFGMTDCHPVITPLTTNQHLLTLQCPTTPIDHEKYSQYANGLDYLSLVGSLLYATQTRPDIQYAVGQVMQFPNNPGIAHLIACKRILRYLKGTKAFSLQLGGLQYNDGRLIGWSDANWVQDQSDRRSVSGWCFAIDGSVVLWSLKKQTVVATLTVEAEYTASSNAIWEAIWLRHLLKDLDFQQMAATIIYTDSTGSIALLKNPVCHSHAKHIDICYHYIRECIAKGDIKLERVSTHDMIANTLTKALP